MNEIQAENYFFVALKKEPPLSLFSEIFDRLWSYLKNINIDIFINLNIENALPCVLEGHLRKNKLHCKMMSS